MPITVSRRGLVLALFLCFALNAALGCKKDDASDSGGFSTAGSAVAPEQRSSQLMKENGLKDPTVVMPNKPSLDGAGGSLPANGAMTVSNQMTLPPVQIRQVIRKADLDIRVENVEKAERAANAAIEACGGYTDSASSTDLASAHPELTMTARIPVGRFEGIISKFESLGVRLSKTISSEDVTGHIVDMDAELKTLKIQAELYRNMLKNKTQLSDVFEVEQQLTNVQTQIEDIDARRKSEAGLAALSTITLKLEQNGVVSQPSTDPGWMSQSWASATSGASGALRAVTVIGMWVLCFAPFWIPLGLLVRKLLKQLPKPPVDPIAASLGETLNASRR